MKAKPAGHCCAMLSLELSVQGELRGSRCLRTGQNEPTSQKHTIATLLNGVRHWIDRTREFAGTTTGGKVLKATRAVFLAGVVGLLIYQLSEIGWARVLTSLPTIPIYYVLVLAMYFLLPVTESLIYGRLWGLRPFEGVPVMIRKRVLNVDVVGYSGEVYLFLWARERLSKASLAIMGTIKDNLIVSSAASLSAAALLIGGLLLSGKVALDDFVERPSPLYAGLGAVAALFAGIMVFRFRHFIFSLPKRVLPLIGAAHLARFIVGYVLQVVSWWVVIPSASFETWALLLVVSVLINRIPFLPSTDLVFVSAGAGLSPVLDVPVAAVVGMLLVRSTVDRLLNLLFFSTSVWYERHRVSRKSDFRTDLDEAQAVPRAVSPDQIPVSLNS